MQVGDPEADRVLVALTPLPEVFEEAEEKGESPLRAIRSFRYRLS
jgi:hypothetical protein